MVIVDIIFDKYIKTFGYVDSCETNYVVFLMLHSLEHALTVTIVLYMIN